MTTTTRSERANPWMWVLGLALAGGILLMPRDDVDTSGVKQVGVDEARALIELGAVVVDVRGAGVYDDRHIPGAISVPLDDLRDGAIPDALATAIAKPVVVYCGDGVTIGPTGTALLNQAGFTQAVNLQPGIRGWADAGLPVAGAKVGG